MKKLLISALVASTMFASSTISGNVGYQLFQKNQIEQAITILTTNSKKGDLNSVYLLGVIYGQMKHYDKSIQYLTRAAWLGHASAQSKLALIYHYGLGGPKNNVKAFYWLKKAAKQNIIPAQYVLGRMYIYGDNPVKQNFTKAAFWLNKTKEKGYKDSKYIWITYDLKKYL
jgi:TPR repeat protein